jgi:Flp pilus assembly pilin Flp
MGKLMLRLWNDDCGALIATEWVFLATILVLGSITGLVAVRQAVISQFAELANAVMALDQSYSFSGQGDNCSDIFEVSNGRDGDIDVFDFTHQQVHTAGSWALDFPDTIGIQSNVVFPNFIDQPPCD